jgi:hypothetical protein
MPECTSRVMFYLSAAVALSLLAAMRVGGFV